MLSFILMMLAYGYELTGFSLSIDEELETFPTEKEALFNLISGRWGAWFLQRLMMPVLVLPYYPFIFSIIAVSASAALFIAREDGNIFSKLVFLLICVSHPLHSHYLCFNTTSIMVSSGWLLSVVAYILYNYSYKDNTSRVFCIAGASLILAVAISLYQAVITVFIVLCFYNIFIKNWQSASLNPKLILKKLLFLSSIILFAFIGYKTVDFVARWLLLDSNTAADTHYLDNLYGWNRFKISAILGWISEGMYELFAGKGHYGGFSSRIAILMVPVLILIIWRGAQKPVAKTVLSIALVFFVITPFSHWFNSGLPLPVRTMAAFAFMLGIIWWKMYESSSRLFRLLILFLAMAVFINNTYNITRLFYSGYLSWQADRALANNILKRIHELDPPLCNGKIKVEFAGYLPRKESPVYVKSEVFGFSFFEWGKGMPTRMIKLYKTMGVEDLEIVVADPGDLYLEWLKSIPSWPAKGSVCLVDSTVIVKLSNPVLKKP